MSSSGGPSIPAEIMILRLKDHSFYKTFCQVSVVYIYLCNTLNCSFMLFLYVDIILNFPQSECV